MPRRKQIQPKRMKYDPQREEDGTTTSTANNRSDEENLESEDGEEEDDEEQVPLTHKRNSPEPVSVKSSEGPEALAAKMDTENLSGCYASPSRNSTPLMASSPISESDSNHHPVRCMQGEEPLDLSMKSDTALDLSLGKKIKAKTVIPPVCNGMETKESSSLKSLEQKFGGNALDNLHSRSQTLQPTILRAFGSTSLYNSALYNAPSLPVTDVLYKRNMGQHPSVDSDHRKFKSQFEQVNMYSHDGSSNDNMKHTNFVCSCQEHFESLYELSVHMKEKGHVPNSAKSTKAEYPKLVRGQDMWLNQGTEQTRQILRCMKCGESFKSLPELTMHMMQTRHYRNIVSSRGDKPYKTGEHYDDWVVNESVFKCKKCQHSFPDMEALAKHMYSSGHHKKPYCIRTSCRASSSPSPPKIKDPSSNSRRHTPTVASLLEFKRHCSREPSVERDEHSIKQEDSGEDQESSKITCENCAKKIDTSAFVEHVRLCVKKSTVVNALKERLKSPERQSEVMKPGGHEPMQQDQEHEDGGEDTKTGIKHLDLVRPVIPATQISLSDRCTNVADSTNSLCQDHMNESSRSSALKEMEDFIERSFMGRGQSRRHRGNVSRHHAVYTSHVTTSSMDSEMPDSTAATQVCELGGGKEEEKFPHIASTRVSVLREGGSSMAREEARREQVGGKDLKKEKDKCNGQEDDDRKVTKDLKKQSGSNGDAPREATPEGKESQVKLEQKYLCDEDSKDSDENGGSALESLYGLVHSQSFSTEHPLDSLQKLIHNTEHRVNPNGSSISGTSISPGQMHQVPGTVILVNPIFTVVPQSSANASVQISISDSGMEKEEETASSKDSASPQAKMDNDEPGEFLCQACNRSFSSKGSYRYHLSRCHLTSVKKYGVKDAINMSPYVYLPLDHSAKFNKYYEMAKKLANKGKEEQH